MRSARVAEWILAQVLPPYRAASTVGDWMEDAAERGPIWFWSSVFRTVFARVWSDFAESPGFMVSLALRGWLYSTWLMVGTLFLLILPMFIVVALGMLAGYWVRPLHWHPSQTLVTAVIAQVWMGWCEFQTGRWIARRAPGRELAAGISACVTPVIFVFLIQLVAMQFWGAEINQFITSHPGNPGSVPTILPSEIFLLAGILWSRHKFIRSVAQ